MPRASSDAFTASLTHLAGLPGHDTRTPGQNRVHPDSPQRPLLWNDVTPRWHVACDRTTS